ILPCLRSFRAPLHRAKRSFRHRPTRSNGLWQTGHQYAYRGIGRTLRFMQWEDGIDRTAGRRFPLGDGNCRSLARRSSSSPARPRREAGRAGALHAAGNEGPHIGRLPSRNGRTACLWRELVTQTASLIERRMVAAEASGGTSMPAILNAVAAIASERGLGGSLLDFGSGKGDFIRLILRTTNSFSSIWGVDIAP